MKAVMLVGGFGTRLRPLTLDVKKELMPVANRPFLEHVLAHLAKHGVDEAILTTGYLAEAFRDFPSSLAHGVKLTIVKEDEPLDSCGAVKNVEDLIDGTFLVCNGDILTSLDITALVAYHRERETLGTLALNAVDDPSAYGLVPIDDDGRIERFVEKPKSSAGVVQPGEGPGPPGRPGERPGPPGSNLINAGTYVLEPETLNYVPGDEPFSFEGGMRSGGRVDVGLFPLLLAEGEALYGFVSNDYWLDIGSPAKYLQANHDVLGGLAGLGPPGIERDRGIFVGRTAEIDPSANLVGPVVIGEGVRIGRGAVVGPRSSIGNDVEIGEDATVAACVLHDGVVVEDAVVMRDSIVATGCVVGHGTDIWDAVVGAGVKIGADNELREGVRLWPGLDVGDRGITFTR